MQLKHSYAVFLPPFLNEPSWPRNHCCVDAALQLVMPTGLLLTYVRLHTCGHGPCVDCKIQLACERCSQTILGNVWFSTHLQWQCQQRLRPLCVKWVWDDGGQQDDVSRDELILQWPLLPCNGLKTSAIWLPRKFLPVSTDFARLHGKQCIHYGGGINVLIRQWLDLG